MEHSLEKYIDRQSTKVLLFLYYDYLEKPDDPINQEVLACIRKTLMRRNGGAWNPEDGCTGTQGTVVVRSFNE